MCVHQVEVEELRAAPADTCAMNGGDQDLGIGLQDFAECTAGFDLLLDCWSAGVWRLKSLARAVMSTFAASAQ